MIFDSDFYYVVPKGYLHLLQVYHCLDDRDNPNSGSGNGVRLQNNGRLEFHQCKSIERVIILCYSCFACKVFFSNFIIFYNLSCVMIQVNSRESSTIQSTISLDTEPKLLVWIICTGQVNIKSRWHLLIPIGHETDTDTLDEMVFFWRQWQ